MIFRLFNETGGISVTGVITSMWRSCSSIPPGACGILITNPSTDKTLSTLSSRSSSGVSSVSVSATAWMVPQPSRMTRKLMPPIWRSECSQPAIRTRSPACEGTSIVRMRFNEMLLSCATQKALILSGGRGLNHMPYRGTTTIAPNGASAGSTRVE